MDTGWLGRAALASGRGALALSPAAPLALRGSHAGQGAPEGRLNRNLAALADVLSRLSLGLAPVWEETCILVASEFGRTVAINGTGGTDHGTGGVCFVLGGAVRGGRVHGDWPGLGRAALHEGRDLRPTTDVRAVFKAALQRTLGLERAALGADVFPGSRDVKPLAGLFG